MSHARRSSRIAAAADAATASSNEAACGPMKLHIVEAPGCFKLTAHSSREKAAAFVATGLGSRIMTNSGAHAAKGQSFCEVDGVVAGDTIHVPLYFSDLTGESYIGGAFATEEEAADCLRRTKSWSVSAREKGGSGELYMRKMVLDGTPITDKY